MTRRWALACILLSILALPVVLFCQSNQARAIESFGIGAVPANPQPNNPRTKSIFIYELEPGSVKQDALKVINNSKEKKTLAVYAVDSVASSDGAFACAQAADKAAKVGSWLQLGKTQVTLEPHTNEIVPFTLTMPQKVSPGEHNGCLAVQDLTHQEVNKTNGIVLSFRSALRVAVTVPGDLKVKLDFSDIKVRHIDEDRLQISPVLTNKGNVSVDTNLQATLSGVFGNRIDTKTATFAVLVDRTSQFNFEFDKPFWGGWYKYTAQAQYNPTSKQGQQQTAARDGWVFIQPQPEALLIMALVTLVILVGIAIIAWRILHRRRAIAAASIYTVRHHDTLLNIAERADVSWKRIAQLNHIKPPYELQPGQTLRIPKQSNKTAQQKAKPFKSSRG